MEIPFLRFLTWELEKEQQTPLVTYCEKGVCFVVSLDLFFVFSLCCGFRIVLGEGEWWSRKRQEIAIVFTCLNRQSILFVC